MELFGILCDSLGASTIFDILFLVMMMMMMMVMLTMKSVLMKTKEQLFRVETGGRERELADWNVAAITVTAGISTAATGG